jgi:hypothetical protein
MLVMLQRQLGTMKCVALLIFAHHACGRRHHFASHTTRSTAEVSASRTFESTGGKTKDKQGLNKRAEAAKDDSPIVHFLLFVTASELAPTIASQREATVPTNNAPASQQTLLTCRARARKNESALLAARAAGKDADRATTATRRLRVLAAHLEAPPVTQTTVGVDLLEALEVVAPLADQVVGNHLRVLARLVVLLSVEEPHRDLELLRVLDDGNETLDLVVRQLTSTVVVKGRRVLASRRNGEDWRGRRWQRTAW